jgi:hypothetical protein
VQDQVTLLHELEEHSGGPLASARLLAVDYTGSYAKWKTERKNLPRYIRSSILAHIALYKTRNIYLKEHL